ncbi:MAG: domain containing protein, partial [Solirubrobacterales bacterium]|nr:domain containing protein [Solirubrobacterales bacterium]
EPKDCARGRVSRVEFGPIVAIARSQAACFEQVKGGFVSKGPVTLNGMILSFPDNGKITIEPTDNHLYSTSATMNVSGFQVPVGKYDMRPLGAQANRAVKVTTGRLDPPGSAAKVGGLTVNAVDYSLSKDDDGTAKLTWDISAPDAFSSPARQRTGKPRPEDALSFSWAISTSGADGPNFTGRATIARALFKGAIEVNNLVIGFDTRSGTWNGGLTVLMPGGSPSVSATVAMGPGGLRQLALAAQQINRPIGTTGIFLQKLGGEYNGLTAAPFLSLSGGVSAGPAIKVLGFNGQLIGVDGQLKISLTASPDVEISGTGSLANFKIADGSVKYATNTGLATFSGDVAATFPGGGLAWSVRDGTLNDPQLGFSLLGTGEARLWGLRKTVSVTAMKGGGMACWGTAPKRAGVSFGWGSNQLSHIGEGACDIGSLRKANLRHLRAGGGSGVQTVRLAAQPIAAFEVVGQGAPPQIALITPTGTSTEIRAAVDSKDLVAWRDESRNTLHVIVYDPAPGDWKLTPLAGSAPLASVAWANALPQPKVTATLRGGQLRVALQPQPDQQVRLVEKGKFGQRTIATIERSKQLRVKPAAGVGGSRRIVAQVLQDGLLRDVKTLVRYTAKTSQVPSPRQLKITRRAGTATLAWRGSVKEYVVVGALSGGRRPVWVTKRPALTIKGLRAGDTGTLQVIAVGADRRRSAPATIRLRASRATRAAR